MGPLQLDYEWLESNMAPSAGGPPLSRIRKPSAGYVGPVRVGERLAPL